MKTLFAMFLIMGFSAHANKPIVKSAKKSNFASKQVTIPKADHPKVTEIACNKMQSGNIHTAPRYVASPKLAPKAQKGSKQTGQE